MALFGLLGWLEVVPDGGGRHAIGPNGLASHKLR
jgi:hypothetical protein